MNTYNFRLNYVNSRSYTLGNKHPLVSISKVLYSSMSNPAFYNIYNKQVDPTPTPEPLDPNLYANLDALLATYGLSGSNVAASKDTANTPFWELLYQDSSSGLWYDYAATDMSIQNIDPSNYNIVKPDYVSAIIENGYRFEYYGESYVITPNIVPTDQWPTTKYIPFKNNASLTSPLLLIATLDSLNSEVYNARAITRTSCFVFRPSTTCFLLVYYPPPEVGELEIYCMQTWTNSTYKELDPLTNMPYLNTYLADPTKVDVVLPPYFTFVQCNLDDDAMIALFSNPSMGIYAQVMTDGVGNNYQYVRREEAPFLYEDIEQGN